MGDYGASETHWQPPIKIYKIALEGNNKRVPIVGHHSCTGPRLKRFCISWLFSRSTCLVLQADQSFSQSQSIDENTERTMHCIQCCSTAFKSSSVNTTRQKPIGCWRHIFTNDNICCNLSSIFLVRFAWNRRSSLYAACIRAMFHAFQQPSRAAWFGVGYWTIFYQ